MDRPRDDCGGDHRLARALVRGIAKAAVLRFSQDDQIDHCADFVQHAGRWYCGARRRHEAGRPTCAQGPHLLRACHDRRAVCRARCRQSRQAGRRSRSVRAGGARKGARRKHSKRQRFSRAPRAHQLHRRGSEERSSSGGVLVGAVCSRVVAGSWETEGGHPQLLRGIG